jgi:hypothetical protein
MKHSPVPLALYLAIAGCGDEKGAPIDVGPTGPPSIAFVNPPSGGEPPCYSIAESDFDARIVLVVEVEELVLQPPGACGQLAQCGHLALSANGVPNNESAVRAIELLLRKLGDRYHDGSIHAGTDLPDYLRLRVELVGDQGEPRFDHQGEPLADEIELITVPDCSTLSER